MYCATGGDLPGPANQTRYATDTVLPRSTLAIGVVVAQVFSVVGNKQDDGVIRESLLIESVQDFTDIIIDFGDHRIVPLAHRAQFILANTRATMRSLPPLWDLRQVQRSRIVHVQVFLRHNPW
jgi:hypothetical protein